MEDGAPRHAEVDAYAALDLGTNNCRLLVAAPVGDGFRVLESFSRLVQLGEGLHDRGSLCESAMTRTLTALHGCAERLTRRKPRAVRAIATEACRRASNGPAFLDRIRAETGLAFEVISSREEAELALESCAPLLAPLAAEGVRRALLFDIGGGSTELAWLRLAAGDSPMLSGAISLPIGVASLSEPIERSGFGAVVDRVAALLQPFDDVHRIAQEVRHGGVVLVGTSGTATTLAGVALDLPRYRRPLIDGVVLDSHDVERAIACLRALPREQLAAHPCVGADRVGFVLPGCAVFQAIHRVWPAPRVLVADRGLREGMLLRMMRLGTATRRSPFARAGALGAEREVGLLPGRRA